MKVTELKFVSGTEHSSQKKYPAVHRKKKAKSEFDNLLESYRMEMAEDFEEYSVNLPQHSLFKDNGYEDVSGV